MELKKQMAAETRKQRVATGVSLLKSEGYIPALIARSEKQEKLMNKENGKESLFAKNLKEGRGWGRF